MNLSDIDEDEYMAEEQDSSVLFIEMVDKDTRETLFRMLQKFTGLKAEIEARRLLLDKFSTADSAAKKSELALLMAQADETIGKLDALMNMKIPEDLSQERFLQMTQEDLQSFKEKISENLHQISEFSTKI
ncbi:Uncharacterised protein [Legionella londiniensis]|nr:Uncharacterised protein [Legionella londiniensis]